jgi:hypothetical protein
MSKELLTYLRVNGLTEYGAFISEETVRECLGIEFPEVATKKEFDAIALQELGAIDYVRGALINEGKYIKGILNGYRVLTPSENAGQVEAYMSSADGKLRRAIKLAKNTPKIADGSKCNSELRALMKREAIQAQRDRYKSIA